MWLIIRSGTKPSRITYPCQLAAVNNLSFSLKASIPFSVTISFFSAMKSILFNNWAVILAVLAIGVISGGPVFQSHSSISSQEIIIPIEPHQAIDTPTSDIYVINGHTVAHVTNLITLMSTQGLFFYESDDTGENQHPSGLIAHDDVVLLKINSQWSHRGGTNTDLLKEVIQAIIDHPDGFAGEIVIADNGQGFGSMDYSVNNAEDRSQSTQDVVDMYSSNYTVSTYDWQQIRNIQVNEYNEGDLNDGYIRNATADPETGIYSSYPKFETVFGTKISFKFGIWNGNDYNKNRLKVINMPVLKSHFIYGVTACLKNYMGVQSESLNGGIANGHMTVGTGGMGTLLVDCGLPVLNILDALWINANPFPSSLSGPETPDNAATRINILMAGVDPVALDYWATRHVLMPTATSIGYDDLSTLDPEYLGWTALREEVGIWFNLTKHEILRGGFTVTSQENRMNVYVNQNLTIPTTSSLSGTNPTDTSTPAISFGFVCMVLSLPAFMSFYLRRRRRK
ncbi:MAG: DUF362 domain-containing protein [Candidatus Hodarchaeales archaeon]